jgi:hypothetical protein
MYASAALYSPETIVSASDSFILVFTDCASKTFLPHEVIIRKIFRLTCCIRYSILRSNVIALREMSVYFLSLLSVL